MKIKYYVFRLSVDNGSVKLVEPTARTPSGGELQPFWSKGYGTIQEAESAIAEVRSKGEYVIMPVYVV
jgi:hypothetical protein